MADWLPIDDAEIQPDAPILSSIAVRFRDNPIALAQNAPGAPDPNFVPRGAVLLSGSGNYSVPADVHRLFVIVAGAGAGGQAVSATNATGVNGGSGGSTTFGSVSASGGSPTGSQSRQGASGGAGGFQAVSNESMHEVATGRSGGSGQMTVDVVSVTPGQSIAYSVGSGGSGGTTSGGSSGSSGADGFIYVMY